MFLKNRLLKLRNKEQTKQLFSSTGTKYNKKLKNQIFRNKRTLFLGSQKDFFLKTGLKGSFWFMTGLFRVIFQFLWGRFNSIFFWTFVVWKLNWVILSSSGSFITWKAYSNTPMFLDHVPDCFSAKFRNKSTNKNKGTRTSTRLFLTTVWRPRQTIGNGIEPSRPKSRDFPVSYQFRSK